MVSIIKSIPTLSAILISCFLLPGIQGCSSTKKTVETTETTTSYPDERSHEHTEVQQKTTEVTTTEDNDNDSCGGVLSCVVEGVGEIIAFPFKLIGSLFSIIF